MSAQSTELAVDELKAEAHKERGQTPLAYTGS